MLPLPYLDWNLAWVSLKKSKVNLDTVSLIQSLVVSHSFQMDLQLEQKHQDFRTYFFSFLRNASRCTLCGVDPNKILLQGSQRLPNMSTTLLPLTKGAVTSTGVSLDPSQYSIVDKCIKYLTKTWSRSTNVFKILCVVKISWHILTVKAYLKYAQNNFC